MAKASSVSALSRRQAQRLPGHQQSGAAGPSRSEIACDRAIRAACAAARPVLERLAGRLAAGAQHRPVRQLGLEASAASVCRAGVTSAISMPERAVPSAPAGCRSSSGPGDRLDRRRARRADWPIPSRLASKARVRAASRIGRAAKRVAQRGQALPRRRGSCRVSAATRSRRRARASSDGDGRPGAGPSARGRGLGDGVGCRRERRRPDRARRATARIIAMSRLSPVISGGCGSPMSSQERRRQIGQPPVAERGAGGAADQDHRAPGSWCARCAARR